MAHSPPSHRSPIPPQIFFFSIASVDRACRFRLQGHHSQSDPIPFSFLSSTLLACATIDLELPCSLIGNPHFSGSIQPEHPGLPISQLFPLVKDFHPCNSLCPRTPKRKLLNTPFLHVSASPHHVVLLVLRLLLEYPSSPVCTSRQSLITFLL